MISRAINRRQPGRRWITLGAITSLIAGTLVIGSTALAFTQSNWELDKNATHTLHSTHLGGLKSSINSSQTTFTVCELVTAPATPFTIQIDAERMTVTNVASTTVSTGGCAFAAASDAAIDARVWTVSTRASGAAHVGSPPRNDVTGIQDTTGHDWDQVYAAYVANGNNPVGMDCSALGAVACIFKTRPNTGTATAANNYTGPTTFTQTSGDTQTIGQWRWTNQSVPDADEINDAYAAKYDAAPDQQLFFGMDRFAVNGSKDIGFWFFHQAVSPNPDGTFSGAHCAPNQTTDGCPGAAHGDLLLLTTFSGGGAVTTVRAYEWVGSGGSDGPLDFLGAFGDCVPGNATDKGCATTANSTVPAPWAITQKPTGASANTFYSGGFMEGGIDLSALNVEGCFASFMGTSRSSPSLTAQPKAFVLGGFEACTSGLETTPSVGKNGTVAIGSDGTVSVSDDATLDVHGASTWSGTLKFFICGPLTSGTCDGTTNVGTQVGSDIPVDQTTSQPINSGNTSLTSAGDYCWRAEFISDNPSSVPDASDSSSTECFTVTPLTPTIGTQLKKASDDSNITNGSTVPSGTSVYDTATLSGGTSNAGGKVQYRVYSDNTCTTLLSNAFNTQTDKTVTNGVAAKSDNITLSPGTYYFQATYSTGDANNVAGAKSDCSSEVVIAQSQPAVHSTPVVQIKDSVTVTGLTTSPAPTGNLVVGIYTENTCTTRLAGTSDETFGIAGTQPFVSTFTGVAQGTYYFKLSYAGDTFNAGFSDCTENVGVTITSKP